MSKILIDTTKISKDVLIFDNKKEKLAYIKVLRELAKLHKENQFNMSLEMLKQFNQIITLLLYYLQKTNNINDFYDYAEKLTPQFKILFDNFFNFKKRLSNKNLLPIFGISD